MDPDQRSMVMVRIGDQELPAVNSPKCSVCQSLFRLQIENELILGRSYRGILRDIENLDHGGRRVPSVASLARHAQDHLPINKAVERRLIERRAKAMGKSIEDDEGSIIDHITVAEMTLQKGFEKLQKGQMDLQPSDVMAAAKFLYSVEKDHSGDELNAQITQEALMEYMRITMQYVPRDQIEHFREDLRTSPVLRALADKQREAQRQQTGSDL